MKIAKATSVVLVNTMTTLALAQPMDPAAMGYADQMEKQRIDNVQNYRQQQDAAAAAEANARWWAKERRILANIAKYKATPYYGSLIARKNTNAIGWGGGVYKP